MCSCIAQNASIDIVITDHQNTIGLNSDINVNQSKLKVTKWQCYLSHFIFYNNAGDSIVDNNYYLVDLSQSNSLQLDVPSLEGYSKVSFAIGVDSMKTMEGVMDDDLDPIKGMFWTWQSGYINFKVELEDEKGDEYNYHIGGFSGKQNSFRQLHFTMSPNTTITSIQFDMNKFISFCHKNQYKNVMSPGEKSSKMADHYIDFFSIVSE